MIYARTLQFLTQTALQAILLSCLVLCGCSRRPVGAFQADLVPASPDYSKEGSWAALPTVFDSADLVPDQSMQDRQDMAKVDVFFLYPTTYTGKKGQRDWNGDVYDAGLNLRTDRGAIRNQASVFNGSCRVYAPRYRQAHLRSFYTKRRKEDASAALNLAYKDVDAAFAYYLKHHNQGRPLIIAGHSQGTLHAAHLLQKYYDDEDRDLPPLIVAYLVGMPVDNNTFKTLEPCAYPDDTGCFCSWRTVHEKYRPGPLYPCGDTYCVTNPVTWTVDKPSGSREVHQGAVLTHFYDGITAELVDVRTDEGLLRVSRPKIPGVPILFSRNYHIADYNLFYSDIRQNVASRVEAYFSKTEHFN
jgi:hypothetical protein